MKRTFQEVYDNRENGNKIDNIFDELGNKIAIDPDNKSDAVKRIVCILTEVSKACLPDLRMASLGARVRGMIGVILQVSLPFTLLCTKDCVCVTVWPRGDQRECVMDRELIVCWCNLTPIYFSSCPRAMPASPALYFISLPLLFCLLPKTTQYGDTSSDAIVVSYLHNAGIYWARDIMIGAICANLLIQTACVYMFNQPITEVGLIFTMLKPAADMVRVVSNFVLLFALHYRVQCSL